jgi:hypothetical protein
MSKDSARCVGPRGPSPRGQVLLLCPSTSFENNACKVLPSSEGFCEIQIQALAWTLDRRRLWTVDRALDEHAAG